MNFRYKTYLLYSFFLLTTFVPESKLYSQTVAKSTRYYTVSTAYSPHSSYFLGKTKDSQTFSLYLGTGKEIGNTSNVLISYRTFGFIPYIEYHYPKRDDGNHRDIAYGLGISPLGYTFNRKLTNKSDLDFGIKSGIMFLNKKFPTDQARRLNYSFDLSLAFQHFLFNKTSVSLGYKFHHLSNAQTGKHNPGIDSNFIFFTLKYFSNGH